MTHYRSFNHYMSQLLVVWRGYAEMALHFGLQTHVQCTDAAQYNQELMSCPKGGRNVQQCGTAFDSERL